MAASLKLVDAPTRAYDDRAEARGVVAAPQRSLLRFITCGSVDDGKSTLLGRLLFETGAVFEDQLEALERDSARFGTTGADVDFALLVDGLSAEREQGITIDVAYRYFATPRRAFIAADTPGHEQYTRNMATGASTADVAIILVDARKGILPQTRRHSYIVSMLGVRRVIVAVNKIDLVGYSEDVFRGIERDYRALAQKLDFVETHIVPVSARFGDNVVEASDKTPWRTGPSLLALLESIETAPAQDDVFRLPVQWVNRPNLDFRGFSGTIASGSIGVGDRVVALPRGRTSRVARIVGPSGDIEEAGRGQSITLVLADEIDVSRGDVLVAAPTRIEPQRQIEARLLAMNEAPLAPGRNYLVKIGTNLTTARIAALRHAIDVHDYSEQPAANLPMNAIGVATLRFETDLVAATYRDCQALGGFILIDPYTNDTVGLGVVQADAAAPARRPAFGDRVVSLLSRADLVRPESGARDLARLVVNPLLTALVVLVVSGALLVAVAAGLADAVLRPALGLFTDAVWKKIAERRDARTTADLTVDGGSI
ncbi:MAG: sulfate adenylyltransferase subunit CysN [Hyphomicrobiales bacterium]|nr:sulfate adenylyltransferase subunit CysN [Hyphomicrobiales bacterium]